MKTKTLVWMVVAAVPMLSGVESGRAADQVNLLITVTNGVLPGITNGDALTVNGSTRTGTNVIASSPSTLFLATNVLNRAKTNLYYHVALYPFGTGTNRLSLTDVGTNAFRLTALPGQTIAFSITGTWGMGTLATNPTTVGDFLALPLEAYSAGTRTNYADLLVAGINKYARTNAFSEGAVAMGNFVGLTAPQTVSGKVMVNAELGSMTGTTRVVNTLWVDVSPGGKIVWAYLGEEPTISIDPAGSELCLFSNSTTTVARDVSANARDYPGVLLNYFSSRKLFPTYDYGNNEWTVWTTNRFAGTNVFVVGMRVGYLDVTNLNAQGGTFANMTGTFADLDATNAMLRGGTASNLNLSAPNATNGNYRGTSTFAGTSAFGGRVVRTPYYVASLANGNNSAMPIATNSVVRLLAGPTGAFAVCGIDATGVIDGQELEVQNMTGQNMTVAHESGSDSAAANRIVSLTGADQATVGNGAAWFSYNTSSNRWVLTILSP